MKFKLLYLVARLRGFFPEKHEYDIYAYGLTETEIKEIYEQAGWIPYRIADSGVGFITSIK